MLTTEQLFMHRDAFGVTTATPLQRAICRVSDGLGIPDKLWGLDRVRLAFGGGRPRAEAPDIMIVLSAIRGAKTTMAVCAAFRMSQSCDVSGTIPGDEIRIPILSVDKDSANATYGKLVGAIQASPILRSRLCAEPTQDSVRLMHPSGREVEIKVVALAKYGSTVVSRWLAGVIFDEAPLMAGEESVRNLAEARRAVQGRILPGGQEWLIGSPWGPVGPVYDLVLEHQGRPSKRVCVVRAPGPDLNPVWWTPERCEALRTDDPKAYRTNVLAEFADPEETLFPSTIVEPAMRREPLILQPEPLHHYVAAIDPATRGNAWTLVVVGHYGFGGPGGTTPLYKVALCKQWAGSSAAPLNPDLVLGEVADEIAPYGLHEAYTDQWSIDALRQLAERHQLDLQDVAIDGKNKLDFAEGLRAALQTGCLELPPDRVMRQDLVGVRKRITTNGHTLVLPKTGDGRHCDYVPPLYLCIAHPPEPPLVIQPEPPYEPSFETAEQDWSDVAGRFLTMC